GGGGRGEGPAGWGGLGGSGGVGRVGAFGHGRRGRPSRRVYAYSPRGRTGALGALDQERDERADAHIVTEQRDQQLGGARGGQGIDPHLVVVRLATPVMAGLPAGGCDDEGGGGRRGPPPARAHPPRLRVAPVGSFSCATKRRSR